MDLPSLPGYRLLRPLGGGKSFKVWEARPSDDDDTPLVVKHPRSSALEKASTLILLRREARAGRHVDHPRVVRVVGADFDHELPFIVMEFVPGESLKQRLARFGRLSARRAVWTARQVAEGLAALHRAGFVHADVKPGNVLLGPRSQVKLIDLGFAHRRGENKKLVEAGFTIGTANYLAPELCIQPVREGPAADVFALGVTMFECLTGRVPYPADSVQEAIRLRRRRRALDLGDYRGNWPTKVVEVVRSILAREPSERPTAASLVRDLTRLEVELFAETKRAIVPGRLLNFGFLRAR
jgi:serine/threonine protein kinase